jgi:molecular chaperone HtpG
MARPKEERFAFGSVLEALSRGLYPDKRHVLREFVQNSFDSLSELRRASPKSPLSPIQIKIDAPSIFIGDKGLGMRADQVRQYRYLGFSEKNPTMHAGFRGIGKYSAIAIAEKIIVDSSPLGEAKRYRAVIHADRMMETLRKEKNPPLERVLRDNTEFSETSGHREEHFTFVELHKIRSDSAELMNLEKIRNYMMRIGPAPLDPSFPHAARIERTLKENLPNYLSVEITLNGEDIYKPFFENCLEPEFETVLFDDKKPEVLAFCWYCQNHAKGQFDPKEDAGQIFRVKNIAVGDGQLSRRMLWKTTPERSFYFFGEIHVLDPEVVPSSDRTDFEDNTARDRLINRCMRVSTILRQKAGKESALRRFDEAIEKGNEIISTREGEVKAGDVPVELKDQVVFEIQKLQEDVKKRLQGPKTPQSARRARRLLGKTRRILRFVKGGQRGFVDLQAELSFDPKLRTLYETIMEVLREEFRQQPERLERLVRRIHDALRARLSA